MPTFITADLLDDLGCASRDADAGINELRKASLGWAYTVLEKLATLHDAKAEDDDDEGSLLVRTSTAALICGRDALAHSALETSDNLTRGRMEHFAALFKAVIDALAHDPERTFIVEFELQRKV
jgi:hypothetical protein